MATCLAANTGFDPTSAGLQTLPNDVALQNPAAAALRQAAALPCLDVNRPPLASGFVLEMFRTHRRFSNAAENPIWNDSALSESRARFGRLPPDKAGFPASGTSFLSFCLHIVLGQSPTFRWDERAALFPIIILFQRSESRRP